MSGLTDVPGDHLAQHRQQHELDRMKAAIGIDGGQSEIRARFADRTTTLTAPGLNRLEGDLIDPIVELVRNVRSIDPRRSIELGDDSVAVGNDHDIHRPLFRMIRSSQ